MKWSFDRVEMANYLSRGLRAFEVPEPITLAAWAEKHFYLSKDASYTEQAWRSWPFQRALLACMGNDVIQEVTFKKSARVGYSKMLLAAIGYFAAHKRRKQAVWQPTDGDRDEFVKTEIDPMMRDVAIMREVMPKFAARHKDNTLSLKKFIGSTLYLRSAKAAKNFRRITIDVAALDELDSFDADVEKEGDPVTLAVKRVEGATFPKLITGSTPKLRATSLIEARELQANVRFKYHVHCPTCEGHHALSWWAEDQPYGFKWVDDDPETVKHLCPHCGVFIEQFEYLRVAERGFWAGDDGSSLDHEGIFRNAAGDIIKPPRHVAFHVWTAYNPTVAWPAIVREYLAAASKEADGDTNKVKTFINTTLGLTYEGEVQRTDADELKQRAEPFSLRMVPKDCLLLLAGADTQDNRIEIGVWGYGRGSQMWTIDHHVIFGNPGEEAIWTEVEDYLLNSTFPHAAGAELQITGTAVDSGGHHTQAVYEFAYRHKTRVFAVKGRQLGEKSIKEGNVAVDIDWRGRRRKNGTMLWHVGTNHAKDLLFSRLTVSIPGPGYVHFSNELTDEWFRQFTGESRVTRRNASGIQSRWTAMRRRVEALDCAVYATWLEWHIDLQRKSPAWWLDLEQSVQPVRPVDLPKAPVSSMAGKVNLARSGRFGAPNVR